MLCNTKVTVSAVAGALGTVPSNLEKSLEEAEIKKKRTEVI